MLCFTRALFIFFSPSPREAITISESFSAKRSPRSSRTDALARGERATMPSKNFCQSSGASGEALISRVALNSKPLSFNGMAKRDKLKLSKKSFGRCVASVLREQHDPEATFTAAALRTLQAYLEQYVSSVVRDAEACREHAERQELEPEDFRLTLHLRTRRLALDRDVLRT